MYLVVPNTVQQPFIMCACTSISILWGDLLCSLNWEPKHFEIWNERTYGPHRHENSGGQPMSEKIGFLRVVVCLCATLTRTGPWVVSGIYYQKYWFLTKTKICLRIGWTTTTLTGYVMWPKICRNFHIKITTVADVWCTFHQLDITLSSHFIWFDVHCNYWT